MNNSRFDELTKMLATSTSRRQALKTLGATIIGAALGMSGLETAFARRKLCQSNSDCLPKGLCIGGKCCPNPRGCVVEGTCCPSGFTCCSGVCVQIKSDPKNCGGCGIGCAPNEDCVGGTCQCLLTNLCNGTCCIDQCCTALGGTPICCPSPMTCNDKGSFPFCCPVELTTNCIDSHATPYCCPGNNTCCTSSGNCCPPGFTCGVDC
jgi:hypothetical protein